MARGNGRGASKAVLKERLDTATAALNGRQDGWANLLTGMGLANRDKRKHTVWKLETTLRQVELEGLYRGEGFSQRVVNLIADDMVREWFEIEGDEEKKIVNKLDELRAKFFFNRALRWARLYGGSVLIVGAKDSGDFETPLNEGGIQQIEFLRVEHRYRVTEESFYTDPNDERFGKTEMYMVSPLKGMPYRVHETRLRRFDGVDVPDSIRQCNNGWGDSVLQAVYPRLKGLGEGYCNIETIIAEFILGTLNVNNLADLIATGREDLIQKRLTQMDLSKHVINTLLLDKDETYQRLTTRTTGLDNLIDRLVQSVSAVTGYPVTLLMGQSPAGLRATGDSDVRLYYDMVSARQETQLQPQLEWLVRLLFLSKELGGKEPDSWMIHFNPLWQPTEKEVAETHNIQAEADERYVGAGVLEPGEVAQSRFGGRVYSLNTTLSDDRNAGDLNGGQTGEGDEGGADTTT